LNRLTKIAYFCSRILREGVILNSDYKGRTILQQMTAKRLGFIGIIIEHREQSGHEVNKVLSQHGDLIIARTGIPHARENTSVITLVIDATTDELGRITGQLGTISGVTVKSGLAKI
jgi:putative iron-only hydrogenase system regulator